MIPENVKEEGNMQDGISKEGSSYLEHCSIIACSLDIVKRFCDFDGESSAKGN